MTTGDMGADAEQPTGLSRVFTPAQAAEILRRIGLIEMTECALRTRAYRKQIPFHLNGHRVIFTMDDLREIAEGRAFRPQEAEPEAHSTQPASKPELVPVRSSRRKPRRSQCPAPSGAWRARRPRDD